MAMELLALTVVIVNAPLGVLEADSWVQSVELGVITYIARGVLTRLRYGIQRVGIQLAYWLR